jgi:hypothetical protein
MRTLTLVTLLSATVFADEAADLFYRAFWLEQSGRGNAEAEKLYRELIDKHASAPEAPRAYLALIRMRSAKGVKVDDMLKALEKGYPAAKKEIDLARKLAARLKVDFDSELRADDTPLQRKLKTIYGYLTLNGKLSKGDEDFLQDVGAAGHTMLSAALRSSNSGAVYDAAKSLARQNTSAANQVLIRALQDESVLYRLRIIDAFLVYGYGHLELVNAMHEIWPRASRSMRRRITRVWARGTMPGSKTAEVCYGHLATALADEDEQVRMSACAVNSQPPYTRPSAWVAAAMPHVPSKDSRLQHVDRLLPWQVVHEELRPKIEKGLIEREGPVYFALLNMNTNKPHGISESMAKSWTRIALARTARDPAVLTTKSNRDQTRSLARHAAMASHDSARALMRAGLERGDKELVDLAKQGLNYRWQQRWNIAELGDLTELKRIALQQSYSAENEARAAASNFLRMIPLNRNDLGILLEVAKQQPGRGLPKQALSPAFFKEIGPAAAAKLVPLAKDHEIDSMLSAGWQWLSEKSKEPADARMAFWRTAIPRATPKSIGFLRSAAHTSPELAYEVALLALGARDAGWNWGITRTGSWRADTDVGPQLLRVALVREQLASDRLKAKLYALAADDRWELAQLALQSAAQDESEAAITAYRAAMRSRFDALRERSVKGLRDRGSQGAAQLVAFLKDEKLPPELWEIALQSLARCGGKEQMPYVRERLDARPQHPEAGVMWSLAFEYDRAATIDRAFAEVFGDGPSGHRNEALDVLRQISDERRIAVFRKILREEKDEYRIHRVLRTVADQYLIELGPEVLLHLRNPDSGIRGTATKAIERLKFYAEAKKLFEKEGK